MDLNTILEAIWKFCNSSFGFAFVWAGMIGLFWWLASKYNPFLEKWKEYEGSIITATRLAEKEISDDTPNAGLARLDSALRFVLKAYSEANNGKEPSEKLIQQLKEGIQITHNDLARFGKLGS